MSTEPTGLPQYLSIREVAEILAVSQSTVRNLVQNRQLPAVLTGAASKTVRIALADLTTYLDAHRTVPVTEAQPQRGEDRL